MQGSAAGRVMLDYGAIAGKAQKKRKGGSGAAKDQSLIANLSGIAPVDDWLWTASDEEASLARLQRHGKGYGRAQSWDLAELFPAFATACTKARTARSARSRKRTWRGLPSMPRSGGCGWSARIAAVAAAWPKSRSIRCAKG